MAITLSEMLPKARLFQKVLTGLALFFAFSLFAASGAITAPVSPPWFQHSLVGMEVGPTGAQFGRSDTNDLRYCARFNGTEIVRRCVDAHCQYAVIWARDGDYAYYDSKLLIKCPGLGSRDPLREAVEEGRRQKLPIIAYCVVQQAGHFLDAHPEFEMRDSESNRIGRFCFNSGYLEAMKQIVSEQLTYGIDGFHIDMLDQGFGPPYGCWCDSCRQQFEAEFKHPMPKGVTWDDEWDQMLEFRYRSSERFEKALYAHIKSLNPRATVDFNYHGSVPYSFDGGQRPVQHASNGDFNSGETGVWGFSALAVGLSPEFYRAATPGKPFQVAMQRGVRLYHDQTTRPLNDLRWELLTLLSHSAFVTCVDKTAFDGGLDPVAYQRIGAAFADALARREHFGQSPVAEVGLFYSSRTRDWYARLKPDYFQAIQGAHKAMVYEHIPWGILLDENLTLGRLKSFAVVMLPNAAILSTKQVDLFRQYVEEGGGVIITGVTGILDGLGRLLNESVLSELIGAKFAAKLDSLDNWVRFNSGEPRAGAIRGSIPNDWQFLIMGPAVVYSPTTATPMGELMKPFRTTRQLEGKESTSWPMSAESPVGPAVLINHFGKGTVVTFAASPDFATGSKHHLPEDRELLRNAVRLLNPNPRVNIIAPLNVETVVSDDPATHTMRIHLLGYNSPPQNTPATNRPYLLPVPIEQPPLYRVQIDLDREIKRANVWNKTTLLNSRSNHIEATINDIHEVLVMQY